MNATRPFLIAITSGIPAMPKAFPWSFPAHQPAALAVAITLATIVLSLGK